MEGYDFAASACANPYLDANVRAIHEIWLFCRPRTLPTRTLAKNENGSAVPPRIEVALASAAAVMGEDCSSWNGRRLTHCLVVFARMRMAARVSAASSSYSPAQDT
jgi:hypothetical protein